MRSLALLFLTFLFFCGQFGVHFLEASCAPKNAPVSGIKYVTVNLGKKGSYVGGFNYSSDSSLVSKVVKTSGETANQVYVPTESSFSDFFSLSPVTQDLEHKMEWDVKYRQSVNWGGINALMSRCTSLDGAIDMAIAITNDQYLLVYPSETGPSTQGYLGVATPTSDAADSGWVRWYILSYPTARGDGYVTVYRDNEGQGRGQCAVVFNTTMVMQDTGVPRYWAIGLYFQGQATEDTELYLSRFLLATAVEEDQSIGYVVGGIAGVLILLLLGLYLLITYYKKKIAKSKEEESGPPPPSGGPPPANQSQSSSGYVRMASTTPSGPLGSQPVGHEQGGAGLQSDASLLQLSGPGELSAETYTTGASDDEDVVGRWEESNVVPLGG